MIAKSAKPTTAQPTQPFRLEPRLRRLLPPLTEDEFGQLEKNILDDPSRVTLVVWSERGVLLDGHNRYDICKKHGLRFRVKRVSLPDLDAAKLWINEHLGRRHFTDEQKSYWRGKQYELAKKPEAGRPNGKWSHCETISTRTRETIANQHGVAPSTIARDAKFARAVDAITTVAGEEARRTILARDMKIGRQEVQKLAEIAEAQPQAAKNVLIEIQAAQKPEQAKRIIHEAFKQLPRLEPCEGTPRSIEAVKLKGGDGFIIHNPDSEPKFIPTNEMVDWASWTWSPVTGCWHGCDYCYARAIANDPRMAASYPNKFEPTFHEARLNAPKNTPFPKTLKRPQDRNVFVCSMADLFGKWVPDEWIVRVFEQVRQYGQWNFLFLTKFPQRLRSVCDDLLNGFPDNAWVGCTVDSQARVTTAEKAFRDLRAKVRWLSVEPMQERLVFTDMTMFDWLVVGGKSASTYNGTPEFQPQWEWVEELLRQARGFGLGVYFKENLTVKPKEVPWAAEDHGHRVASPEPEMLVNITLEPATCSPTDA